MKVSAPSDETLVVSIAEYVKSGLGSPVTSGLGHSMYVETAGGEVSTTSTRLVKLQYFLLMDLLRHPQPNAF